MCSGLSACLVLLAFLLEPRTSAVVAEVLLLLGVVCGLLVIRGAWRTWHKPSATSRWVTRSLGARRQLPGTVGRVPQHQRARDSLPVGGPDGDRPAKRHQHPTRTALGPCGPGGRCSLRC